MDNYECIIVTTVCKAIFFCVLHDLRNQYMEIISVKGRHWFVIPHTVFYIISQTNAFKRTINLCFGTHNV